jgi:hypothetical protein
MLPLPLRAAPLALLVVLSSLLAACGNSYQTTEIKQYKLTLVSGDPTLVPELKKLVADYNQQAGIHVLDYVDDPSEANSAIVITQGLRAQTGDKVGLGQWLSETKTDSPLSTLPGAPVKRTVTYTMRVEFDHDYMTSSTHYDNQKLFFHEVGHGLQMDHISTDISEVMYPDVGGTKNFAPYLQRVRAYMADQ